MKAILNPCPTSPAVTVKSNSMIGQQYWRLKWMKEEMEVEEQALKNLH